MRRIRFASIALFTGLALVAGATPAVAETPAPPPIAAPVVVPISDGAPGDAAARPDALGTVPPGQQKKMADGQVGEVCAQSPEGETTCVAAFEDGTIAAGLPDVVAPPEGEIRPQWTIGVGWYVYLYLNRGDIHWLLGLGFAMGTAVLCGWLASTIVGGAICAGAAYVIWSTLHRYAYTPWGKCLELKFRTGLNGAKLVTRNC